MDYAGAGGQSGVVNTRPRCLLTVHFIFCAPLFDLFNSLFPKCIGVYIFPNFNFNRICSQPSSSHFASTPLMNSLYILKVRLTALFLDNHIHLGSPSGFTLINGNGFQSPSSAHLVSCHNHKMFVLVPFCKV